ncbi:hypothetical protein RQP46_005274 [Phenoliferia psychrophenolica]
MSPFEDNRVHRPRGRCVDVFFTIRAVRTFNVCSRHPPRSYRHRYPAITSELVFALVQLYPSHHLDSDPRFFQADDLCRRFHLTLEVDQLLRAERDELEIVAGGFFSVPEAAIIGFRAPLSPEPNTDSRLWQDAEELCAFRGFDLPSLILLGFEVSDLRGRVALPPCLPAHPLIERHLNPSRTFVIRPQSSPRSDDTNPVRTLFETDPDRGPPADLPLPRAQRGPSVDLSPQITLGSSFSIPFHKTSLASSFTPFHPSFSPPRPQVPPWTFLLLALASLPSPPPPLPSAPNIGHTISHGCILLQYPNGSLIFSRDPASSPESTFAFFASFRTPLGYRTLSLPDIALPFPSPSARILESWPEPPRPRRLLPNRHSYRALRRELLLHLSLEPWLPPSVARPLHTPPASTILHRALTRGPQLVATSANGAALRCLVTTGQPLNVINYAWFRNRMDLLGLVLTAPSGNESPSSIGTCAIFITIGSTTLPVTFHVHTDMLTSSTRSHAVIGSLSLSSFAPNGPTRDSNSSRAYELPLSDDDCDSSDSAPDGDEHGFWARPPDPHRQRRYFRQDTTFSGHGRAQVIVEGFATSASFNLSLAMPRNVLSLTVARHIFASDIPTTCDLTVRLDLGVATARFHILDTDVVRVLIGSDLFQDLTRDIPPAPSLYWVPGSQVTPAPTMEEIRVINAAAQAKHRAVAYALESSLPLAPFLSLVDDHVAASLTVDPSASEDDAAFALGVALSLRDFRDLPPHFDQ